MLTDERPWKRSRPFRTASQASETTSSASAGVRTKLRASRGDLAGLRPEELFPHDQDHYGGVAANDELAKGAAIGEGTRVADFCAGWGYLAAEVAQRSTGLSGLDLYEADFEARSDEEI